MDLSIFDFNCLNKNDENSLIYILNNNKTKNLNFNAHQLSYIIKNIRLDYDNIFTGNYVNHYLKNFYTQDIHLLDEDFVTLLKQNKFYNSIKNGNIVDCALLNPAFFQLKSTQLNIFFDYLSRHLDEKIVSEQEQYHTIFLLQQIHTYPNAIEFFHQLYLRLKNTIEIKNCIFTISPIYDFSKFMNYIKSSTEKDILQNKIENNYFLEDKVLKNFKI